MAFVSLLPLERSHRLSISAKCTRLPLFTMSFKVLVTGASGRTGNIVFKLLRDNPDTFDVTGFVRDTKKASEMFGSSDRLVEGDILVPESLESALKGKDALVLLTSALPRVESRPEGRPPSFYYDSGGMPEDVDWIGACNQIDISKRLGVSHIVFVGSMGSTDDNNHLNKIGNGNILKFKRKAELYLIDSGVPYTIINPSGLLLDPPNERELVIGNNDELFSIYDQRECGIPRADVARVIVSALTTASAKNKVFDIVAKPKGQGRATSDVSKLFETAAVNL